MNRDPDLKSSDPAVDDIVGPGRTEKIVRPEPVQTGRRISGWAKGIAGGACAGVVVAIAAGVLLARHPGRTRRLATDKGAAPSAQVGQASPPAPSVFAATHGGVAAAGGSGGAYASANVSGALVASAGGVGGTAPPAQRYRQWLVRHRYKMLEGQVRAAQAARAASPLQDSPMLQGSGSGGARARAMPSAPVWPGLGGGAADMQGQDANRRFLEAQSQRRGRGMLAHTRHAAVSRHELFAGSVVPAVLLTGIDSDLPGEIVAQVRQNVDNSLNPDEVLIPQGARLIGVYSSEVAYGQRRVLVAWRRIIFPEGATLALSGMPGTDSLGRAGFRDLVDNHYLRVFGSAFLISVLGAGAQLAQPQNAGALNTPGAAQQAAANLANGMDSAGANLLNRNLTIAPTLRIRPGYLFDVLVTRTVVLPAYRAVVPRHRAGVP